MALTYHFRAQDITPGLFVQGSRVISTEWDETERIITITTFNDMHCLNWDSVVLATYKS